MKGETFLLRVTHQDRQFIHAVRPGDVRGCRPAVALPQHAVVQTWATGGPDSRGLLCHVLIDEWLARKDRFLGELRAEHRDAMDAAADAIIERCGSAEAAVAALLMLIEEARQIAGDELIGGEPRNVLHGATLLDMLTAPADAIAQRMA